MSVSTASHKETRRKETSHSSARRSKAAGKKDTGGTAKRGKPSRWSQKVMETSDALDLEQGVFARDDPRAIARSLKKSAEASSRRKAEPFRSAMSMLTFYINRAGHNLPEERRAVLEQAKDELRTLFHRPPASRH